MLYVYGDFLLRCGVVAFSMKYNMCISVFLSHSYRFHLRFISVGLFYRTSEREPLSKPCWSNVIAFFLAYVLCVLIPVEIQEGKYDFHGLVGPRLAVKWRFLEIFVADMRNPFAWLYSNNMNMLEFASIFVIPLEGFISCKYMHVAYNKLHEVKMVGYVYIIIPKII